MKKKISAIVVTYNRKEELIRCIESVVSQSLKPDRLVLIDNASTDNTLNALLNKKIIQFKPEKKDKLFFCGEYQNIKIYICSNEKNTGGSGGFYLGLKCAHKLFESDFYWMMDDDGYPSKTCLEQLMQVTDEYDYVMPASIDINDHSKLSWEVRKKNGKKTICYEELKESWGNVMEFVTPFNGILLSKKCVDKVGYINRKFFIWGDEYDHFYRCKEKGVSTVTLLDAVFYHPSQKLPLIKICGGLMRVTYVDSPLRMICLARNYTYIYMRYHQKPRIIIKFLMYTWLFIITRKLDIKGWLLYVKSVRDGVKGDFSRHLKYLQ